MIKIDQRSLRTSINSIPIVIANTLGYDATRITHQYYNPNSGWELAIEKDQHIHILICVEKDAVVKIYQ